MLILTTFGGILGNILEVKMPINMRNYIENKGVN